MQAVIDKTKDPKNVEILDACFGRDWEHDNNINEVKNIIHGMSRKKFIIDVPQDQPFDKNIFAEWNFKKRRIELFNGFFSFGWDHQAIRIGALVLIHEASHAFGTVDGFSKPGFLPVRGLDSKSAAYKGYLLADFKEIRFKAGAKALVRNADSYALMAHIKAEGFKPMLGGIIHAPMFMLKKANDLQQLLGKQKRLVGPSPPPPAKRIKVT